MSTDFSLAGRRRCFGTTAVSVAVSVVSTAPFRIKGLVVDGSIFDGPEGSDCCFVFPLGCVRATNRFVGSTSLKHVFRQDHTACRKHSERCFTIRRETSHSGVYTAIQNAVSFEVEGGCSSFRFSEYGIGLSSLPMETIRHPRGGVHIACVDGRR